MDVFGIVVGGSVAGICVAAIIVECIIKKCCRRKFNDGIIHDEIALDNYIRSNNDRSIFNTASNNRSAFPNLTAVIIETLPPYQTREEYLRSNNRI